MPVVLLVVVAVVWIAILGRGMVRRRSVGTAGDTSISDFHQQLRILEHSSPAPIVAPAFRLHAIGGRRVTQEEAEGPERGEAPVLTVVGAKDLPRPALAFLGQDADDESGPPGPAGAPAAEPLRRQEPAELPPFPPEPPFGPDEAAHHLPPDPLSRRLARRRRRDILAGLLLVFVLTLLAGFLPGAELLWTVTAASGVALGAYVALLVQLRHRAEERERKLHYLATRLDQPAALVPDDAEAGYAPRGRAAAR